MWYFRGNISSIDLNGGKWPENAECFWKYDWYEWETAPNEGWLSVAAGAYLEKRCSAQHFFSHLFVFVQPLQVDNIPSFQKGLGDLTVALCLFPGLGDNIHCMHHVITMFCCPDVKLKKKQIGGSVDHFFLSANKRFISSCQSAQPALFCLKKTLYGHIP